MVVELIYLQCSSNDACAVWWSSLLLVHMALMTFHKLTPFVCKALSTLSIWV